MRQKLSVITLGVRDFQRALTFFESGLGWKRSAASQDDVAFFPLGGYVLAIYPRHLLAEDAKISEEGTGFTGITLAFNAKDKDEVNAVLQQAADAGATITKPAQDVFWGGYSGYFRDPEGFLFEVAYNPFWPLDEAGNVQLP